MALRRWVVVDDTAPTINYIGTWFQDTGNKDKIGTFGPPYLRTLHGTSGGGTVEFEFSGSAIEVWGTNEAQSNLNPTFNCFVDESNIGRVEPSGLGENNVQFCSKTLPDGLHRLRIDVQAESNQTFWLDRLHFIPSATISQQQKVIVFENTDPAIQLDSQWTTLGSDGSANMTRHTNSTAEVKFNGTSVSWIARIPASLPHPPATGTWAMDGGGANQFPLPGLPAANSPTLLNQVYFTTPEVKAGPHTLTVTFLGSNETTPLCLDHLYIQNGTLITSTNSGTTTTPSPSPHYNPSLSSSRSRLHTGAILGSALGGTASLIIGIILFRRRRRALKQRRVILAEETIMTPLIRDHGFTQDYHPHTAPQAGGVSTLSSAAAPPPQVVTVEPDAGVHQQMDSGARLTEQSAPSHATMNGGGLGHFDGGAR